MSKLFNIAFVLSLSLMVSNPSVASYHMDEMSGDSSGSGYSSSNGILAVVAVGAIGYVIYKNRNQSENTSDVSAFLSSQKNEPGFQISFRDQRQKMSFIETNDFARSLPRRQDLVSVNLHYRF